MDDLKLPDGFKPLTTQVAGHTFHHDTKEIGLIEHDSSSIVLKPLGKPECGEREYNFYEKLKISQEQIWIELRKFVPTYHCRTKLSINDTEQIFLKLENLTYNIKMPCVMDIKIGIRTWDPLATTKKRTVEEQKYSSCKRLLGLCVPGFQYYQLSDNKLVRHGKEYGKKLKGIDFCDTMAEFLNTRPKICTTLINEILRQLYKIQDWFREQTELHFYASSILIIYDFKQLLLNLKINDNYDVNRIHLTNGNNNAQTDNNDSLHDVETMNEQKFSIHPSEWIRVRMIDFAHVFEAEDEYDINYKFGLDNLIKTIENFQIR